MAQIDIIKSVTREAGRFMLGASSETEHTEKSNAKDFVTVADIKSQTILRDGLRAVFPDAIILSEEDSELERETLYELDFTGYVLDPIDGTFNFKRDMRESAISVGYIQNGQPVIGVIYDPYKDELFEAQLGQGALRNGKPIHVSGHEDLASASMATGNSYDAEAMARNIRRQLGIYEQTGAMPWFNCPGSGVLNIAYVACGRFDAFHHNGLKPWDNAAGFVIAQEAGAVISDMRGEPIRFTSAQVLVATPAIHRALVEAFSQLPVELLA